jgi:hypothetical protein
MAIAYLSVQKLVMGVILGSLSIAYICLTMTSLTLIVSEIKGTSGTSFKGADLTNARFDQAIHNTEFKGAIGYDPFKLPAVRD